MRRFLLTLILALSLGIVFLSDGYDVAPLALRAIKGRPVPLLAACLLGSGFAALIVSDLTRPRVVRATLGCIGLAAAWVGWIDLAGTSELFWLFVLTSIPFAAVSLLKLLRLFPPAMIVAIALPASNAGGPGPIA